jgi:hypothetical protein
VGEYSRDSRGIPKGFWMIPHGRNLSLESLLMGTPQREVVSWWLVGVRVIPDDRTSWLGKQPCELRRDAHTLVMYACRWRCHTAVQDRDHSDPPPFSFTVARLYRMTSSSLSFSTTHRDLRPAVTDSTFCTCDKTQNGTGAFILFAVDRVDVFF